MAGWFSVGEGDALTRLQGFPPLLQVRARQRRPVAKRYNKSVMQLTRSVVKLKPIRDSDQSKMTKSG